MTFLKKLLSGFLILMLLGTVSAYAQDTGEEEEDNSLLDPYIGDSLSINKCIAKGNVDFIIFLRTLIYSDGFWEGVIEPWIDVLFRNQCHATDVMGLINQRDKIRAYIRDAFLTCKSEKIPNLKRAYNEINTEIYYVRHVVDGISMLGIPFSSASVIDTTFFYPREKLYKEMKEKYVDENSDYNEEEFNVLFERIQARYQNRIKSYLVCEKSSWEEVSEKWDEFIDGAGGILPAVENMEKGLGGRGEKLWESMTDFTYVDYTNSIIQISLNNQPFLEGAGEILAELDELATSPDFVSEALTIDEQKEPKSIVTYDQILKEIGSRDYLYRVATIRNQLSSRFKVLYMDTGDSSVEAFLSELDNLNSAIENSFKPMNKVFDCVSTMNDKQCP